MVGRVTHHGKGKSTALVWFFLQRGPLEDMYQSLLRQKKWEKYFSTGPGRRRSLRGSCWTQAAVLACASFAPVFPIGGLLNTSSSSWGVGIVTTDRRVAGKSSKMQL